MKDSVAAASFGNEPPSQREEVEEDDARAEGWESEARVLVRPDFRCWDDDDDDEVAPSARPGFGSDVDVTTGEGGLWSSPAAERQASGSSMYRSMSCMGGHGLISQTGRERTAAMRRMSAETTTHLLPVPVH